MRESLSVQDRILNAGFIIYRTESNRIIDGRAGWRYGQYANQPKPTWESPDGMLSLLNVKFDFTYGYATDIWKMTLSRPDTHVQMTVDRNVEYDDSIFDNPFVNDYFLGPIEDYVAAYDSDTIQRTNAQYIMNFNRLRERVGKITLQQITSPTLVHVSGRTYDAGRGVPEWPHRALEQLKRTPA